MAKRVFKGTKISGQGAKFWKKWTDWSEGDYIIGNYVGSKMTKFGKPAWIFNISEATFSEDAELSDKVIGENMSLNSCGMLDKAMKLVKIGNEVQVTYQGSQKMQGGDFEGKESHLIEVINGDQEEEINEEDEELEEYDDGDEEYDL